jgi:hypothetical protein
MKGLSGNKDADLKILQNLEDTDFPRVCEVNQYVNKLCSEDVFWLNRFLLKTQFTKKELDQMRKNIADPSEPDLTYRKLYEYLYLFNLNQKKSGYTLNDIVLRDNVYLYKVFCKNMI